VNVGCGSEAYGSIVVQMAAVGAQRKLVIEIGRFRFCPKPDLGSGRVEGGHGIGMRSFLNCAAGHPFALSGSSHYEGLKRAVPLGTTGSETLPERLNRRGRVPACQRRHASRAEHRQRRSAIRMRPRATGVLSVRKQPSSVQV